MLVIQILSDTEVDKQNYTKIVSKGHHDEDIKIMQK